MSDEVKTKKQRKNGLIGCILVGALAGAVSIRTGSMKPSVDFQVWAYPSGTYTKGMNLEPVSDLQKAYDTGVYTGSFEHNDSTHLTREMDKMSCLDVSEKYDRSLIMCSAGYVNRENYLADRTGYVSMIRVLDHTVTKSRQVIDINAINLNNYVCNKTDGLPDPQPERICFLPQAPATIIKNRVDDKARTIKTDIDHKVKQAGDILR